MNTIKCTLLHFVICIVPSTFCYTQVQKITVINPAETVNGYTFDYLVHEMIQWTFTSLEGGFPLNDETGFIHQNTQPLDDVIFLSGNFGGTSLRRLTTSALKPLFIPIIIGVKGFNKNELCTSGNKPGPGQSDASFLDSIINKELDGVSGFSFTLNGENILDDLSKFRFISEILDFNFSFDFSLECESKSKDVVSKAGGFVFALELPVGVYILHYKIEIPDENYFQDITWNLTVVK